MPDEIEQCLAQPPSPNSSAAIAYGLMMQRRGFEFAHLHKAPGEEPSLAGIELAEANELTRKLSDALKRRQLERLTRIQA